MWLLISTNRKFKDEKYYKANRDKMRGKNERQRKPSEILIIHQQTGSLRRPL